MSGRSFSNLDALLQDLLDRLEANPSATRLLARIAFDRFGSVGEQDAFLAGLDAIEREGGVRVLRQGPRHDVRITGVALADPAPVYRRMARTPSRDDVRVRLEPLRRRSDLPAAATTVIDRVAASWERGVACLKLSPGDVKGLENVLRLAAAAGLRVGQQGLLDADFRTFARKAVGDSKALERHLTAIARTLSILQPGLDATQPLQPNELLAAVGITRLPQPLLIHGALELDGTALPRLDFLGVPPEHAVRLRPLRRPAYFLTIENYASFVRHIREVSQPEDALVVYSGGFPSRPALDAIVSLASTIRVPVFHWGDMDPGGVRIFRHLERALATVDVVLHPHLMSVRLLRRFGGRAPESRSTRMGRMDGSVLEKLAALIAAERLVHEQEELEPKPPS